MFRVPVPYISTMTGLLLLLVANLLIAPAVLALEEPTQASGSESSQVDPESVAALSRMGKYLGSKKSLAFDAQIYTEVVLDNEQKLLIGGSARYLVQKPDKLRVELVTESIKRHFYLDGQKFTLVAPDEAYYAELEASGATRDFLIRAARDYGIEVPLADLLEWGHTQDSWKGIQEGFLVGKSKIEGVDVEHWAFRGAELDWEIWIQGGERPLPLRISTVNTKDPARPRFIASLKWHDAAKIKGDEFRPDVGKDHKRIDLKPISTTGEKKQ